MGFGPARQKSKEKLSVWLSAQHLRQDRRCFVVTHHHVVARAGIEDNPRMTEVPVDNARLVLLVVIHPQFDGRLGHDTMVPLNGLARSQGCSRVVRSKHAVRQTAPG